MPEKTLVTFVHLGINPSPNLLSMAKATLHHNPNAKLVLITDNPELHAVFPGEVINYERSLVNPWIKHFISKRREIQDIAGGYWLHTLERVFALRAVFSYLGDEIFIHIESDVYLDLSESAARQIAMQLNSLAVPRFSTNLGIASIMISPSKESLMQGLDNLEALLLRNHNIESDMTLLGEALNSGILEELPTNPNNPMSILNEENIPTNIIFDGAALGQYLFGQDPFHTAGRRISGFINPESNFNPAKHRYSILPSKLSNTQAVYLDDIQVLNLHIHSKLNLPPISDHEAIWIQAIGEANGIQEREYDDYKPDVIHTQKISFLNRFRIAKRRGLIGSLFKAFSRRIHNHRIQR